MDRKEFITTTCKLGLCSCAGIALMAHPSATAAPQEKDDEQEARVKELEGKLDFVHKRFARMIELLREHLEDGPRRKLLESLGRSCARESESFLARFKGDPDAYFAYAKGKWIDNAEYTEDRKRIRIHGHKMEACLCPLVKMKVTPTDFCNCSLGWQKEAFKIITGKSITAEINETLLRGAERCSFTIGLE